jgi:hypothetical protein
MNKMNGIKLKKVSSATFTLSDEGRKKMDDRYDEWEDTRHDHYYDNDYNDYDDGYDWQAEAFEALTDGMCGDYYDDYDGDVDIESVRTSLGID